VINHDRPASLLGHGDRFAAGLRDHWAVFVKNSEGPAELT